MSFNRLVDKKVRGRWALKFGRVLMNKNRLFIPNDKLSSPLIIL